MTWNKAWVGWAAVAVGVGAIVAAFTASSTRVGGGFAFGFGAFIAFFGVLAALARRRTPDNWGLFLVGFAMFLVPFLGNGYQADPGASWTCWVAGVLAMVLACVGMVNDTGSRDDVDERGAGQRHQRSALSFSCVRRVGAAQRGPDE